MLQILRYIKPAAAAGTLLFMTMGACQAQVIINPPVSLGVGGIWHYNYTITNTSATDDLFDVTIHTLPIPNGVTGLVTPTGFKSAFDSGLGLVDFLEDTNNFLFNVPITGFGFDSRFGPGSGVFDGNFLSAASGNIITVSGRTLAPIGSAVPEPGAMALFGSMAAVSGGLFARSRSRRRNRSISTKQGG